ncbi:MAG: hypothetical protein ABW318_12215 [Vicinamibacterales bacterium]
MTHASRSVLFQGVIATCLALATGAAGAQGARPVNPASAAVFEHWTPERRAAAIPRDLVVDPRGYGYLRLSDGTLVPHGHDVAAQAPNRTEPRAVSVSDTTRPTISGMDPLASVTIGATHTFKATVIDESGVKSVTFKVQKSGGTVQSFPAVKSTNDVWSVALQGFTDGDWNWQVVAKDNAARGGNTSTTAWVAFTVATVGGGGSGGTGTVTNAEWTGGGRVQDAAGRLYFEMPANAKRKGPWIGYVCSGTVATDDGIDDGRSVILTAAHCVYDDTNKAFARNVIFIPDQTNTTGTGTDRDCSNDPMGCWSPTFGVVDVNYTATVFPNNNAWDYAFYVVSDTGAHASGFLTGVDHALDRAAGSMGLSFSEPAHDTNGSSDFTSALGYSYNADPNFMYCAEDMTSTNGTINWWLPSCGLTGGSSGGPWVQPMSGDTGPIISVNSWGYTNSPGMAGPKFYQTSTSCVFGNAKTIASIPGGDGNAGLAVSCP